MNQFPLTLFMVGIWSTSDGVALFPPMKNSAISVAVAGRSCDGRVVAKDSEGREHPCARCGIDTEVRRAHLQKPRFHLSCAHFRLETALFSRTNAIYILRALAQKNKYTSVGTLNNSPAKARRRAAPTTAQPAAAVRSFHSCSESYCHDLLSTYHKLMCDLSFFHPLHHTLFGPCRHHHHQCDQEYVVNKRRLRYEFKR